MRSEESGSNGAREIDAKHFNRLKAVVIISTALGLCLLGYFVYSIGFRELIGNIAHFGFVGFFVIVSIYFVRICLRSAAWKLSVHEPYKLRLRDTVPAVMIGEAMSSMIPLGILISGTSKAVAVRKHIPLVAGLSSVATENLFYSLTTSVFLIIGSLTFVRSFPIDDGWRITIDILIAAIVAIMIFLILLIVRQWHFASETCEFLYRKGILKGVLRTGRVQIRLFENLIFGFYRRYPRRFVPIIILETVFHILGVVEVLFILSRISGNGTFLNSFLLESVSRLITIVFKLVPFLVGVDEAGARFVAETAGIGAGIGITLALIRKGRIVFFALAGLSLIVKRGLTLRHFIRAAKGHVTDA